MIRIETISKYFHYRLQSVTGGVKMRLDTSNGEDEDSDNSDNSGNDGRGDGGEGGNDHCDDSYPDECIPISSSGFEL